MPLLDVSEVLTDPDFYDTFQIIQTLVSIQMFGPNAGTPISTASNPISAAGVVVPGKQSRILSADGARVTAFINIYTQFPVSPGYKIDDANSRSPDFIIWKGRKYLVAVSEDYSDFGTGFLHVEADLVIVNPTQALPQQPGTPL